MTPLPDYKKSKYDLLKPGKYTFRITDPPEQRRFGPTKRVGIIMKFAAINEFGDMEESSCLIWPGDEEYRILKDEIIQSSEETDWVGKSFLGEIEIGPHPTKPGKKMQKIVNIQPFPKARAKLGAEEHEEVEDTTVTPPLEEEDERQKEENAQEPTKEDKPSPKDEIEQNKKKCPKEDDDSAPF